MLYLVVFFCYLSTVIADTCSIEVIFYYLIIYTDSHYQINDKNSINVHLICHTHDDLGWLKTVDQYYWGSLNFIYSVGVQYIINTVIAELQRNSMRRFSWAETGFLWRWMDTHNEEEKKILANLIQNGQMEIIGGGWVQNDEGAAHYIDIIDQMTLGLRKLNDTFGRCAVPKIAWQIDPFGHSREMANIFAMMKYEALFFSRYHYLEKEKRMEEQSLEMIWNASDDLGTSIFTGTFYADSYGPPPGFCFDTMCKDEPIMDYKDMDGYNVDDKVDLFISYVKKQAATQQTNHVMLLMGSDFQYSNANTWYTNLDKLIEHENQTKVYVMYSTPACYYEAVKEASPKLLRKTDDFFPYASKEHSYWAGYFTSRPTLKGFIRQSTAFLQLAKQFDAMAESSETRDADLEVFKKALALLQHHDAVTGTAKQAVTDNYVKKLSQGWDKGQDFQIIELSFNGNGQLSSCRNLRTGLEMSLKQQFFYYEGAGSWTPMSSQPSGAYIFRPANQEPSALPSEVFLQIEKGSLVTEIRQIFSTWVSQVIRLYKDKEYVEFEWTVGPIPKEQIRPVSKEVITRYTTDIRSGGTFYTDSNGRQMIKRKRNFAPSYQYENAEPVSANYYPVNTRISIKDDTKQLTILTDRSEGGTSLRDGEIEIMLHRRTLYDDGYGVGEALDEPGTTPGGLVAKGKHWFIMSAPSEAAFLHRPLAYELLYQPILTFSSSNVENTNILAEFSGLAKMLPPQIHLLTLEKWKNGDLLLRLEHIYQKDEHPELSKPATNLFSTFNITSASELTLGANINSDKNEEESNQNRSTRFLSNKQTSNTTSFI
ncbi:unnamed protein product [Enterobius vermicularis]|uniref:alpha-mannosidase n=1 Tax=Enterobius vermicularis TaxID=51028 RepID=A0A158QAW3_ENTVE|nr:unnamed protein product [Enterobius vermicularis]